MILYNVCRNLGGFVVIDVSCSNRGEAIMGNVMIERLGQTDKESKSCWTRIRSPVHARQVPYPGTRVENSGGRRHSAQGETWAL